MSPGAQSCCSGTPPRRSVSELVERGLRRNRAAPLPIEGARCADAEGLSVSFSLDVRTGLVAGIGFDASACATLLAYCELVAETMLGAPPAAARQLAPADLAARLPGVPRLKQSRAFLAVAAFRAALAEIAPVTNTLSEEAQQ